MWHHVGETEAKSAQGIMQFVKKVENFMVLLAFKGRMQDQPFRFLHQKCSHRDLSFEDKQVSETSQKKVPNWRMCSYGKTRRFERNSHS